MTQDEGGLVEPKITKRLDVRHAPHQVVKNLPIFQHDRKVVGIGLSYHNSKDVGRPEIGSPPAGDHLETAVRRASANDVVIVRAPVVRPGKHRNLDLEVVPEEIGDELEAIPLTDAGELDPRQMVGLQGHICTEG